MESCVALRIVTFKFRRKSNNFRSFPIAQLKGLRFAFRFIVGYCMDMELLQILITNCRIV